MNTKGAINTSKTALVLAAVFFLTGFLLIDRSSISGNAVVTSDVNMSPISLIGLALVFIAMGLGAYGIKK